MSRMIITTLIIVVIVLLFNFAGIIPVTTGTSFVLKSLGLLNPEEFDSTAFYFILIGLTTIGGVGIIIGFFKSGAIDTAVYYGVGILMVAFLLNMVYDLLIVFNELNRVNHFLAIMIISPLMVVWFISLYDWVRGLL